MTELSVTESTPSISRTGTFDSGLTYSSSRGLSQGAVSTSSPRPCKPFSKIATHAIRAQDEVALQKRRIADDALINVVSAALKDQRDPDDLDKPASTFVILQVPALSFKGSCYG